MTIQDIITDLKRAEEAIADRYVNTEWPMSVAQGVAYVEGARRRLEERRALLEAAPEMFRICTAILECLDAGDPWPKAARRNVAESLHRILGAARGQEAPNAH